MVGPNKKSVIIIKPPPIPRHSSINHMVVPNKKSVIIIKPPPIPRHSSINHNDIITTTNINPKSKMSVQELISTVKEQYDDLGRHSLGPVAMDIDSLIARRGTRMVKFFGPQDENIKLHILKESLQKRRNSIELKKNPRPNMYTRKFQLNMPDVTKYKRQQPDQWRRGTKIGKFYPPIDILVVPEYDEELPTVSSVRRKYLKCIPDHEVIKSKKVEFTEEEYIINPFFIPKDIPAFMMQREMARLKKRKEDLQIPTIHKQNAVSEIQNIIKERIKPYQTQKVIATDESPNSKITWEAMNALNITHLQKVARKVHANYMTHRRNVFYCEYGVHARQKALQNMRDEEEAEEIGLRNYEYLTSYTTESLDAFLKDNDESSSKASKAAEEKMKENIILNQEVRNLRLETSSLKNDISSINENLRECKYYMKFLDGVARELMRRDEEDAYRIERRQHQIKEEIARLTRQGMSLKKAQKAVKEKNKEFEGLQKKHHHQSKLAATVSTEFIKELYQEAKVQALRSPVASRIHTMMNRVAARISEDTSFDERVLLKELDLVGGNERTDKEELAGLIFTKPSQLLDIYVEVEEQNLSLIQHAQINEEILEAVEHRIQDNRKDTENRSRELRDMINFIESQTIATQERIQTLNLLIDMFTGGYYDVKSQEKMMKLLRKHVNKVYKTSVGANDAHLSSVLMLTSIEKNFEDVVRDLENMPSDVVLKISRDLEKERRESERMEVEEERQKHRDDRIAKTLQRNRAPVKQKRGRTLAFRSKPPKLAVHLTQKDLDKKAEEDEFNYYFGE